MDVFRVDDKDDTWFWRRRTMGCPKWRSTARNRISAHDHGVGGKYARVRVEEREGTCSER
jgi:hypothetical protein